MRNDEDDRIQVVDSTGFIINHRRRAPCIRATATQNSLLKKAFEKTHAPSSDEARALAEETGLNSKWIMQWFGRQRAKERKNDANYKPKQNIPTRISDDATKRNRKSSKPAAFSAAFFSDSASGAFAHRTSAQEIMTVKLEHQEGTLTPSVSGSTTIDDVAFFPVSETSSEPGSYHRILDPGTASRENTIVLDTGPRVKIAPVGRKVMNPRVSYAPSPTLQSNKGVSKFLGLSSPGKSTRSLDPAILERDFSAYNQRFSPQTSRQAFHYSTRPCDPEFSPPCPSSMVEADRMTQSTGRENQMPYRLARLSDVNICKFGVSFLQEDSLRYPSSTAMGSPMAQNSSRKNAALSVQTHWYNNCHDPSRNARPPFLVPETQIANSIPHVALADENQSSKSNPWAMASDINPFFKPDLSMDNGHPETYNTNYSHLPSSFCDYNYAMRTTVPEIHGRQTVGAHPSINGIFKHYVPAFHPDYLDVLDPSRAPLKHLTGILSEYRGKDGTYFSLLIALQEQSKRRKLITCLSNEDLVSRDPFIAAMGLALLSRLGVL